MEWLLFFSIIGGIISSFACYKKFQVVTLFFAVSAAIVICIMLNQQDISSSYYAHYVNGRRVSSGFIYITQTLALFLISTGVLFGIYRGFGAIFRQKNTLTTNITARISNALIFAIIFWPLGFGLLNMLCLGRGRIWVIRLFGVTIISVIISKAYYSVSRESIFLPCLITLFVVVWIYDIIDIIILKSKNT